MRSFLWLWKSEVTSVARKMLPVRHFTCDAARHFFSRAAFSRSLARASMAASLSAAFLDLPWPRASSWPLCWTMHSKTRSWSGPVAATT